MIASAEYAADSGDVITSSPAPMPSPRSASAMASVPVPTPTAYSAPLARANSASNASTSGPSTYQPRCDDAFDCCPHVCRVTAVGRGTSDMNGIRFI